MGDILRQGKWVLATTFLFLASLAINEWVFTNLEFMRGVNWVYLPAGVRLVATLLFGLPGNPVSVAVSFEVFVRSPLRAAMGHTAPDRPRRTAQLTEDLTSPRGKRQFRRGVLTGDSVSSYGPPASHHLRWLASANCLLEIAEDVTELAAGTPVPVWDLS